MSIKIIMSLMLRSYFGVCLRANNKTSNTEVRWKHSKGSLESDGMFSGFVRSEYCSAVANNVYEAKKLIEAGFEYVCSHNEAMLFRKRK